MIQPIVFSLAIVFAALFTMVTWLLHLLNKCKSAVIEENDEKVEVCSTPRAAICGGHNEAVDEAVAKHGSESNLPLAGLTRFEKHDLVELSLSEAADEYCQESRSSMNFPKAAAIQTAAINRGRIIRRQRARRVPLSDDALGVVKSKPFKSKPVGTLSKYKPKTIYTVERISKAYGKGEARVQALRNVNVEILAGSTGVIGPNGSGKSTFLHLLGALDRPTTGGIWFHGIEIPFDKSRRLPDFRQQIAYIHQDLNLFQDQNAVQNVAFAVTRTGTRYSAAKELAMDQLSELGIDRTCAVRYPNQLSGGQRQRVAIARAILAVKNGAKVILADEPTASVDSVDSPNVFRLLLDLAKKQNVPVIVVTHNQDLAQMTDQTLHCLHGRIRAMDSAIQDYVI